MRLFRFIALCIFALAVYTPAEARMKSGTYTFHMIAPSPIKYRIEVGEDTGCCVGSLTIYAVDVRQKRSTKIFYEETFLLNNVISEKDGITVIGQSSDSEAWERKNASTYNPYRVYEISGLGPARYNLKRSRYYTERFYCSWRGPKYNERFAAVMVHDRVCRTMNREQLNRYKAVHPERFR